MINKDEARNQLPNGAVELFDDIVNSRILGASKQTNLICKILASIVQDEMNDIQDAKQKVEIVANYFKGTRGQNSRAIYNAISELLISILPKLEHKEFFDRRTIVDMINNYETILITNVKKSAEYAAALCKQMDTIMIFDYSSTVDMFIEKLTEKKRIYIPESRALDGGKPFLKTAVRGHHDVHFIPDTTMFVQLRKAQAAFIGAETIYPDGSIFNTVGTDILAILCKECNIPLYAISPMIKIDVRNVYGHTKLAPMEFDYSTRLAEDWNDKEKEGIDFSGIKLVKIESKYLSAIITEKGIIPSHAFYQEAMTYNERLEEKIC